MLGELMWACKRIRCDKCGEMVWALASHEGSGTANTHCGSCKQHYRIMVLPPRHLFCRINDSVTKNQVRG